MQAKIETKLGKATLDDDLMWSSDNQALAALLNALTPPFGPSGADPNKWHTLAKRAVETIGGQIIEFTSVEFDPDAVY